jgi:NADPH:quinone reductase-like Zn-dependent oxidoreductase
VLISFLGVKLNIRASLLTAFGGPENFVLKEVPKPTVQPGTLLIKLAATSVNSIDIKIREGALAIAPPLPAVLGPDIAGTVQFDQEQRRSREDLQSVVLRAGFRKDYQPEDERI